MRSDPKKRLLIVVPKYSPEKPGPTHDYVFPLGLAYAASAMINKGLSVEALNLNHKRGHTSDILRSELDRESYFAVCTGGNSLIYNELKEIISTVSNHSSHPLSILGGIVVTSEPEVVFESIRPDYAIMGEGEESAPELLSQLLQGNKPDSIPGTIFSKDGTTVINPPLKANKDIDKIPCPELDIFGYSEWLDNQPGTGMGDPPRIYPILGNRGCPFKCTFCYHYEKYRERSLDSIFDELEKNVPKYNIDTIGLYDDCFSLKMDRLTEFCSRMRALQDKIGRRLYWGVQLTVKNLTPEILQLLKGAGCSLISFGFESFSQPVLDSMRKPITPDEIENALKLTLDCGLIIQGNFIFGDVAETRETYKETLDFWKKTCQGQIQLDIIRLYPGSAIYEQSVKRGIIKDRLAFLENGVSNPRPINFTENMSDNEYSTMLMDIFDTRRRFGVFVIPRSVKKTDENYHSVSVKCPFCKTVFKCEKVILMTRLKGFSYASFHSSCRNCPRRFIITSRFGYLWMRLKSLRYKIVKLLDPNNTNNRLNFLKKGLDGPP